MSSVTSNGRLHRVNRHHPCPVCRHTDYCLLVGDPADPDGAICPRTESPKRWGEAGYFHPLKQFVDHRSNRTIRLDLSPPMRDWQALHESYQRDVSPQSLDTFAEDMAVSADSWRRLGIGWSASCGCWSFPMRHADGTICGLCFRSPIDGKKTFLKESKLGLFIPTDLAGDSLLVCEGGSDTAALLDLGFSAVGRASCGTGAALLTELVKLRQPQKVVIVADGDAPGLRGAESLASVIVAYSPAVSVITPPAGIKDARRWKQAGATNQDVNQAIEAAPVRRLAVRTKGR